MRHFLICVVSSLSIVVVAGGCQAQESATAARKAVPASQGAEEGADMPKEPDRITKSDAEWKRQLTAEQLQFQIAEITRSFQETPELANLVQLAEDGDISQESFTDRASGLILLALRRGGLVGDAMAEDIQVHCGICGFSILATDCGFSCGQCGASWCPPTPTPASAGEATDEEVLPDAGVGDEGLNVYS